MDAAYPTILAFDKLSVRSFDKDGRLRIALANISKAAVNPYRGREIPRWQQLGLDPNKIYRMFRDPQELERAAPTFNELPVLVRHRHQTANDHDMGITVGATGSLAQFNGGYLQNSLSIWPKHAISLVQSGEQKQLSPSYHYRADMTPGIDQGEPYDGVMRDIVGNHVALVKEGRTGADVVVGDSKENLLMLHKVVSPLSALLIGALTVALAPKLAKDAALDADVLRDACEPFSSPEILKDKRADLLASVTKATEGKLAEDAKLDDIDAMLAMLEGGIAQDAALVTPATGDLPVAADKGGDEDEDEAKKAKKKDDTVDKTAMDAAIKVATDNAIKATAGIVRKTEREMREAERTVRPWVGELAVAFDSAEQVYRHALKMLKVPSTEDVHASALPAILSMVPKPGAKPSSKTEVAMDSAAADSFNKIYPNASRIEITA